MRVFLPKTGRRAVRLHPVDFARSASVLLEVVLALVLFVGAATIIASGMTASVRAVERLRLDTHALNLAISVMSELRMHARPIEAGGPEPFEVPFEQWTWKVDVTALEGGAIESETLKKVEVTIRHTEENVVQRLVQVFRADDLAPNPDESATATGATGSLLSE